MVQKGLYGRSHVHHAARSCVSAIACCQQPIGFSSFKRRVSVRDKFCHFSQDGVVVVVVGIMIKPTSSKSATRSIVAGSLAGSVVWNEPNEVWRWKDSDERAPFGTPSRDDRAPDVPRRLTASRLPASINSVYRNTAAQVFLAWTSVLQGLPSPSTKSSPSFTVHFTT